MNVLPVIRNWEHSFVRTYVCIKNKDSYVKLLTVLKILGYTQRGINRIVCDTIERNRCSPSSEHTGEAERFSTSTF